MATNNVVKRVFFYWLIAAVALALVACQREKPQMATLAITDARVWTGNADQPWAEAVASRNEKIFAVGTNAEIEAFIADDTHVISVEGSMLLPGFIDTHVHFLAGGSGLASVQLRDAQTPAEFIQRIGDFAKAAEKDEWILVGAWDHQNWGGELPTRDWIDAVTPDNPVWLFRIDGHMALANSQTLKMAGIDADTPDIDGGTIVRDAAGRPTGILKDNAMRPVFAVQPEPSERQLDNYTKTAMQYVASNGVTTIHDMNADDFDSWLSLATYRRLHARGDLITRVNSVMPLHQWQRLNDDVIANGRGDEWLKT